MDIKILLKDDTLKKLKDEKFIAIWNNLAQKSHNFTVIQEYNFVISWYESYLEQYKPLMIIGLDEQESIVGIIPLAISYETGKLSHAGEYQAEYTGWICSPEYEKDFLVESLLLIKRELGIGIWEWGWLPQHANTSWFNSKRLKQQGVYIEFITCKTPVYVLDSETRINKIKKNKSTKSKINRLNREGDLKIERIIDKESAEKLFDRIIIQYNFRQLSLFDRMPFSVDPYKENWHLKHMNRSDGVHFTVLWQGNKLLACNFGYCSEDTVTIGLFTYDPVSGVNSPGNIFLLEKHRCFVFLP